MAYTGEIKRAYDRDWCRKRRDLFFADKVCVVCGTKDKLELDHIDPKEKTSHRIWSWSTKRREEELSKCQVLCNTHHKEKTAEYCRELFGYKDNKCRQGHELSIVGVYVSKKGNSCKACFKERQNIRRRGSRA